MCILKLSESGSYGKKGSHVKAPPCRISSDIGMNITQRGNPGGLPFLYSHIIKYIAHTLGAHIMIRTDYVTTLSTRLYTLCKHHKLNQYRLTT